MAAQNGLNFNIPIMGTKANSQKLGALSQSIASAEATAGRNTTVFMTGAETRGSGVFMLPTTRIRYLDEVAEPVATHQNTNFSIVGQGFTVNEDKTGRIGYCRDGTYMMDKDYKFVNNLGQYLRVQLTDENGIPKDNITDLNSLTTLDLSNISQQASATQNVTIKGTLPAKMEAPKTQFATNIEIVDAKGEINTLQLVFTQREDLVGKDTSDVTTQVWSVSLKDPKGLLASSNEGYIDQGDLDGSGDAPAFPGGGKMLIEFDNKGKIIGYRDTSGDSTTLMATPPDLILNWQDNTAPSTIKLALGTPGATDGIVISGEKPHIHTRSDGYLAGDFSDFSWTPDGYGIVHFTNNRELTYCRVPLATFPATNFLSERDSGVFEPILSKSGPASFDFPGEGATGRLAAGHREGSSVDITSVYLEMIDTQASYIGNLKTVETIKELTNRLMQI